MGVTMEGGAEGRSSYIRPPFSSVQFLVGRPLVTLNLGGHKGLELLKS